MSLPRTRLRGLVLSLVFLLAAGAPGGRASADEQRFDLAVAATPARAFFEGLVEGTGQNVILEPGVSGTIDLKLRSVTVEEALDAVRDAYGFDYRRTAAGFVIMPPRIQTRLFTIDYLDLQRSGSSRTRVTSGQVSQSVRGPRGGALQTGEQAAALGAAQDTSGAAERGGELAGTSIATRSVSDFWAELEASLRALIGNKEGRDVVTNPHSGVIAVRAMPRELRDVQQYLERIQDVVTRQVVLEAKIIEVELSDGFQAGINWGAIGRDGVRTYSGFQRGPQQGFGSDLLSQPSDSVNLGPGNPVTSILSNTLGGAFTLAIDTVDFNAFIELLKTQGRTRVLSSPRVATLNNQKAVIKAGTDEFFVTNVSSNTIVGTSSATNRDVELTPFFSGIALDVTPQVSDQGGVILHIHPTVSDVTERIKSLKVAGSTDELPLAFSEVRESDSVVKARSGQVIVIGGLMRSTRRSQSYRTPWLGDIPALGNLFRSQRNAEIRSELVILLRPIVVDADDQWQQLAQDPIDRARSLDPEAAEGIR
jgi:MSHA biogenesis protein MshL